MTHRILFFQLFFFIQATVAFSQGIGAMEFSSGFLGITDIQNAGDDRLFIVEKNGLIRILNANGTVNATPFLDLTSQVTTSAERGILGLSFHPNYQSNGFLFVNYANLNGNIQVSRFTVSSNPDVADINTEVILTETAESSGIHNGGAIQFGTDGFLYIAIGDGSSSDRGQALDTFRGKILRIDVDTASGGNNYGIPASNPFASGGGLPEIWSYGLRNPWRFSIDDATGNIWIADVGASSVEEINRQNITENPVNYGWRCYEGSSPLFPGECPNINELAFPIAEYSSASGSDHCSIIGGYVYRGNEFPSLQGRYIFGDYCSGLIGSVDATGTLLEETIVPDNIFTFGEDFNGEVYVGTQSGNIYKIVDSQLGTEDFNKNNEIVLYPNPSSTALSVVSSRESIHSIGIFSNLGVQVYSTRVNEHQQISIPVNTLKSGVYFVKIYLTTGHEVLKKLIIK